MSEQIKPCPFCGGDAENSVGRTGANEPFNYVECVMCGSMGTGAKTVHEAIAAWNKRPSEQIRGEVESETAGRSAVVAESCNSLQCVSSDTPPRPNNWIDTNEQLPPLYERVLCREKDGSISACFRQIDEEINDWNWFYSYSGSCGGPLHVTHWQEIPGLPTNLSAPEGVQNGEEKQTTEKADSGGESGGQALSSPTERGKV